MRTNGNLAYKPEYESMDANTARALSKKKASKAASSQSKGVNVAVAVFYIVIIFAIAFFLVVREMNIYQKNIDANERTRQLETLQSQNKHEKLEIEALVDVKSIEKMAVEDFGMVRPSKNQRSFISVSQGDYVEKTSQQSVAQNIQGGLKNLFGIFSAR